jgi:two-component sensor histidine kinase
MLKFEKPRWSSIGLLLLLWAVAGTLLSLEFAITLGVMDTSYPFYEVAIPQFQRAALWVIVVPLVLMLRRKVPISLGRYWGGVSFHLACSLVLMTLYYVVRLVYYMHVGTIDGSHGFWDAVVKNFWGRNLVDIAYYWLVIGGGYYYELSQRYREKELSEVHLETRLAQAELSMLKGQLQPHFLFNTMNTISVMVREGRNSEAVTLLARLASLLRMSLDTDRNLEMSLGKELDFLSAYMEIQKARFSDRLSYLVEVPQSMLRLQVPSLILQPLVENAVIHGISSKEGPGTIRVSAELAGERLVIRVADNGPGFPAAPRSGAQGGIGLSNTRERLARMYGEKGRLVIDSRAGQGSVVTVELPARP